MSTASWSLPKMHADVVHLEEDAWQLCENLVHSCTESVGGLLSGL